MIKKKLIKSMALGLMILSAMSFNPIKANAEWKQDSKGWWYTEGNSYIRNNWKNINGKWYYFNYEGYSLQNAWMYDGYYLNSNGEWSDTSKYRRKEIFDNAISDHSQLETTYYEAGDQGILSVINNEPCVYAWDNQERPVEIGMNTLNVYGRNNNIIDKIIIN